MPAGSQHLSTYLTTLLWQQPVHVNLTAVHAHSVLLHAAWDKHLEVAWRPTTEHTESQHCRSTWFLIILNSQVFIRYTLHITLQKTNSENQQDWFPYVRNPTMMFSRTASEPVAKPWVNQVGTYVEVTATSNQNRVSDGLKAHAVFKTESLSILPGTLVSTAGRESPWHTTNGSSLNIFSRQAHATILVCSYVCVCMSLNIFWPKLWWCRNIFLLLTGMCLLKNKNPGLLQCVTWYRALPGQGRQKSRLYQTPSSLCAKCKILLSKDSKWKHWIFCIVYISEYILFLYALYIYSYTNSHTYTNTTEHILFICTVSSVLSSNVSPLLSLQ